MKTIKEIYKYLHRKHYTDEDWATIRSLMLSTFSYMPFERPNGIREGTAASFKSWLLGHTKTKEEVRNHLMSYSYDEWEWNVIQRYCLKEFGEELVHYNVSGRPHETLNTFCDFIGKRIW